MTTRRIALTPDIYTKLLEGDGIVQSNSSYLIRIIFSDVPPDLDSEDFHPLSAGQFIHKKNDNPEGSIYARMDAPSSTGVISVSRADPATSSTLAREFSELSQAEAQERLARLLLELRLLRTITEETFQTTITPDDIEIEL